MKVKVGKNVYLQKYDVIHIMHDLNSFPATIPNEVFGDCESIFFFINGPASTYQFESVFKEPANVKWLMEQDWIVDYDKYSKMSLPELKAFVERLETQYDANINAFNSQDQIYRKKHFDEASDKFHKESYKISSLEKLISAKEGKITFILPDEYQRRITPGTSIATSILRKKPDFFTWLFGRGAQQ